MSAEISTSVYVMIGCMIIVMGLFGNTMTFICYNSMKKRSCQAHRFYIQTLTICDTIVLMIGLLRKLIVTISGQDVAVWNGATCKSLNSFGYFASHLSSWTLVGASWERFTAVAFPLNAHKLSIERKFMAVVLIAFAAIDGHHMFTDDVVYSYEYDDSLNESTVHASCSYSDSFEHLETIWPIIDVISYSIAPFLVIGTLNILMVRCMRGTNRAFEGLDDADSTRLNRDISRSCLPPNSAAKSDQETTNGAKSVPTTNRNINHRSSSSNNNKRPLIYSYLSQSQRQYRLTRMLVVFSFTFILLTSPNALLIVISRFVYTSSTAVQYEAIGQVSFTILYEVSELLMYFHHAVQFYLYCTLSVTFRMNVIGIMSRCRRSQRRDDVHLRNRHTF